MSGGKYPYTGINGEYYDKKFLEDVELELKRRAVLWAFGLDTPSPIDKFAYYVLKQIKTTTF